jgi:Predicted metalloendopeptidase
VELRDPKATDHKMTVAEVQKLTPAFDWKRYFDDMKLNANVAFNAGEPKFLAEMNRQLAQTSIADWKTYLTWHLLRFTSPALSSAFVNEDFDFYGAYLNGARK